MLDWELITKILLLLWIANGAPIIAARLLGKHLATPVDFNYTLRDHHRLFGNSKTWRGLVCALLCTSPAAILLGFNLVWGILIGALAMAGDLLSSFIKRRLGFAASERATLLDQIPESLLPVAALMMQNLLTWPDAVTIIILFVLTNLVLSRFLYWLQIRKRPY